MPGSAGEAGPDAFLPFRNRVAHRATARGARPEPVATLPLRDSPNRTIAGDRNLILVSRHRYHQRAVRWPPLAVQDPILPERNRHATGKTIALALSHDGAAIDVEVDVSGAGLAFHGDFALVATLIDEVRAQ